ncbi:MAG TPA: hypothetical protein PLM24_03485 [Methanothrix sp.]|nr:hypothetical protein [Methanothrix sp.]HPR66178.1 hypothetical protein [Methanothrix sp.]
MIPINLIIDPGIPRVMVMTTHPLIVRDIAVTGDLKMSGNLTQRNGAENESQAFPQVNETSLIQAISTPPKRMTTCEQVTLYFGVFFGVILGQCLPNLACPEDILSAISIVQIVLYASIAILIVPNVYQELKIDPASPFLIQFGLFVQNGVFWDVIFNSIGRAIV